MAPTVYLVSGANRGIGLGLVTHIAARPDVIVFAGCRSPFTATDLHALSAKYPGKVHIVSLTSCDKAGNDAAVETIKHVAGRLDVVIANAGIANYFGPAMDTPPEMDKHYHINVIGTLVLFQATYPLLTASTPNPKFVCISTMGGTITLGAKFSAGLLAYGATMCALNYMTTRLHFEHEGLICFPIHPGELDTDMCNFARQHPVQDKMQPLSVEEGVAGIMPVVDTAVRKPEGPEFVKYDGSVWPW